jgi:hypothetical protein
MRSLRHEPASPLSFVAVAVKLETASSIIATED